MATTCRVYNKDVDNMVEYCSPEYQLKELEEATDRTISNIEDYENIHLENIFEKKTSELTCVSCNKPYPGKNTKFCSPSCRDDYIIELDNTIKEIVRTTTHTQKLSEES